MNSVYYFQHKMMFYSTSRLFYRPITTQINALEGRISHLQKKRNLPEAISLFRELVATGSVPSDRTISSLLHMCQVFQDEASAKEVLEAANRVIKPGLSLLTAKLNYYLAHEHQEEAWLTYKQLHQNGHTPRCNTISKLLQCVENTSQIIELLTIAKNKGYELPSNITTSLLERAVQYGSAWREVVAIIMHYYHDNWEFIITEPLADALVKWIQNQHQCEVNFTTITKGYCTNCGYKMTTNILNKDEHRLLTKHARQALEDEVQSFEDCRQEEKELKKFDTLITDIGQVGTVLDGLNTSGLVNTKRLIQLSYWGKTTTTLPSLVIARSHLIKKFTLGPNNINPSLQDLQTHYNIRGIYFFFTRNRVADDHYFVYSALTSGPKTLFVSNDLLGNHIDKYPQVLQPIFKKWQRSSQVHFTDDQPVPENIKYPQHYDVHLQWTTSDYHIPLQDNKWICVKSLK